MILHLNCPDDDDDDGGGGNSGGDDDVDADRPGFVVPTDVQVLNVD